MGGMWLSGLGAGISQAGSMLASYGQDQMYEKRLAAAEKAREARAKADAERQAFLEATTPVRRKSFLGSADQGPPQLKYAEFNRADQLIGSGPANEYEQAEHREGMLAESKRAEADRAKAEAAEARWQRTEEGKDRRASISANRPRGVSQGPRPTAPYIERIGNPDDGYETIANDRFTGEELWRRDKSGKLIRTTKAEGGKPKSFFGELVDAATGAMSGLLGSVDKARDKPRPVTNQAEADKLMAEANKAIESGADPEAVKARLREFGLQVK